MPEYEEYENEEGAGFSIKGVGIRLTPGEMITLKQFALNHATDFLRKSDMCSFTTLDILKKADTIVNWALMVDDKNNIK